MLQCGARLTYYRGRGNGERVRYALAAAGLAYTESYLTQPGDLDALLPMCQFGQAPLQVVDGVRFAQSPLLEIDGLRLSSSWVAVRYLAQRGCQAPLPAAAAVKAEGCVEQVRAFTEAGGFTAFGWAPGFFQGPQGRLASTDRVAAAAARYLPTLEAEVEAGGFLTGAAPCWADFQLLYLLNYSEEVLPGILAAHPRLQQLRTALNSGERMQVHFKEHAKGLVTEVYMQECIEAQRPAQGAV